MAPVMFGLAGRDAGRGPSLQVRSWRSRRGAREHDSPGMRGDRACRGRQAVLVIEEDGSLHPFEYWILALIVDQDQRDRFTSARQRRGARHARRQDRSGAGSPPPARDG